MSNEFFNLVALIVLVFDCFFLISFLDDMESSHRKSDNLSRKEADNED